jgi:hypothetical protein
MALFISSDLKAAEITIEPAAGNGFTVVTIKDKIDPGDDEKFKAVTLDLSGPVLVALASKGGNVRASIAIGRTLRMKGWATMVRNGHTCSSGCALVWLGGATRYGWKNSNVGFHAAHNTWEDGSNFKTVSAVGNALIGAYLNELGFSSAAVEYVVTPEDPKSIKWVKTVEAEKVGIRVQLLDADVAMPMPAGAKPPPVAIEAKPPFSEVKPPPDFVPPQRTRVVPHKRDGI